MWWSTTYRALLSCVFGSSIQRRFQILVKVFPVRHISTRVRRFPDGHAAEIGSAVVGIGDVGSLRDRQVVARVGRLGRSRQANVDPGILAVRPGQPGAPGVVREPRRFKCVARLIFRVRVRPAAGGALQRVVKLDEDHVKGSGSQHVFHIPVRDDALRRGREVERPSHGGVERAEPRHQCLVACRCVGRRTLNVQVEPVDREADVVVVERPRETPLHPGVLARPKHGP